MSPARRAAIGLALIAAVLFVGSQLVGSEESVFLIDDRPARWIMLDRELSLKQLPDKSLTTVFAAAFELAESVPESVARLGATGGVELLIDGQVVLAKQYAGAGVADWSEVTLPALAAGEHELMIAVTRADGPLLASFHAPSLALYTSRNWQAWRPGQAMGRVRFASDRAWLSIQQQSPSVWQSFGWPALLLLLASVAAGYACFFRRARDSSLDALLLQRLRWAFHGAWLLLAALSFVYLPPTVRGFDYPAHIAYIQFIAEQGALPLAPDGWQMFQAPLFYLFGAVVYQTGLLFGDIQFAADLVRLIPLACGLVHIEVAFRLARLLFPQRLPE